MTTSKQKLGTWGEKLVAKQCACPACGRFKTFKLLPQNFKCADLICDFCGFLGQVKTATVVSHNTLPNQILGAAWGPQQIRMTAGNYFALFVVLTSPVGHAVYYLPTNFQRQYPALFTPRKPLSSKAKRAGWQGFMYDLTALPSGTLTKVL